MIGRHRHCIALEEYTRAEILEVLDLAVSMKEVLQRPIAADFAGARIDVPEGDDVQVRLREAGAPEDAVVVKARRGT